MSDRDCDSFKVLLVDADDGFRHRLGEFLRSGFPSVVLDEAADASEVAERVKSFLPQLVFLEIILSGVNGLELTKQIKALYPETQVVILASYDFPEGREAARACGAYGLLPKDSFMPHHVHDMVEELWAKWKSSCGQSV